MEIQIAPAMVAKQILPGEMCIAFFWRRKQCKCTEQYGVTIKITVVGKTLEVEVAVAWLWPRIKPMLCSGGRRIHVLSSKYMLST